MGFFSCRQQKCQQQTIDLLQLQSRQQRKMVSEPLLLQNYQQRQVGGLDEYWIWKYSPSSTYWESEVARRSLERARSKLKDNGVLIRSNGRTGWISTGCDNWTLNNIQESLSLSYETKSLKDYTERMKPVDSNLDFKQSVYHDKHSTVSLDTMQYTENGECQHICSFDING